MGSSVQIGDLDDFLKTTLHSEEDRVFVARKQQIKTGKTIRSEYEPDFLAFHPLTRNCYIVEVKDVDQFDTKKAAGERQMLGNFRTTFHIPFLTLLISTCARLILPRKKRYIEV